EPNQRPPERSAKTVLWKSKRRSAPSSAKASEGSLRRETGKPTLRLHDLKVSQEGEVRLWSVNTTSAIATSGKLTDGRIGWKRKDRVTVRPTALTILPLHFMFRIGRYGWKPFCASSAT